MPPAENSAGTEQAWADAALFARDVLRAARGVMAGEPPDEAGAAYLAVDVVLAASALGQEGAPDSRRGCIQEKTNR